MSFFNQLLTLTQGGDALARVILTLLILLSGHLGVKLLGILVRRFWVEKGDLNKKQVEERNDTIRHLGYVLDAVVIVAALLYLNTNLTSAFSTGLAEFVPDMLSAILIGLLGFIVVNVTIKVGADFLRTIGIRNYFREVGLSGSAINFASVLLRGFLYLLIAQIALTELGIGETFIDKLVTASSWAAAFLIAALLFYGFKDLFQNFAAGIYLKNSQQVRPGEQVNLEQGKGEIREVSLFSTTIDTETGYTLLTPNARVMDSEIKFKRTKSDIDTLEDIKSYFVAQHPSYCGPASMEMALEIFGYRHSQEEIGEKAETTEEEGTDRDKLMEAVEEMTEEEVSTAYVEYDKITDIADEFKTWFNDGAMIVPNFYKPELFPDATTGHYVLSVGVEGDEILVIDPSGHTGSGGVYYVNKDRLYDAMAEFDHSRGYIIVAPEGTTAHWRIKNDLIYSDRTYYDELSKTLEARLRKIMRQGGLLKNAMPSSIKDYMEDWRTGERVTRLWKATEGKDETSEDNKE